MPEDILGFLLATNLLCQGSCKQLGRPTVDFLSWLKTKEYVVGLYRDGNS